MPRIFATAHPVSSITVNELLFAFQSVGVLATTLMFFIGEGDWSLALVAR